MVLMTDHLELAPEMIEAMKRDLVDVISRYVEVDRDRSTSLRAAGQARWRCSRTSPSLSVNRHERERHAAAASRQPRAPRRRQRRSRGRAAAPTAPSRRRRRRRESKSAPPAAAADRQPPPLSDARVLDGASLTLGSARSATFATSTGRWRVASRRSRRRSASSASARRACTTPRRRRRIRAADPLCCCSAFR